MDEPSMTVPLVIVLIGLALGLAIARFGNAPPYMITLAIALECVGFSLIAGAYLHPGPARTFTQGLFSVGALFAVAIGLRLVLLDVRSRRRH